jgi:hypothetical protein
MIQNEFPFAETVASNSIRSGMTEGSAIGSSRNHFESVFRRFTPDQLQEILTWNDDHTYREVIGLIHEKFGQKVSRSSLGRFYQRTAMLEHIHDSPEAETAAEEILRQAVDKEHRFTDATLRILEKTAFNLALTCAHNMGHLDQLNRIIITTEKPVYHEYCNPRDKEYFDCFQNDVFVPDPARTRFLPPVKPFGRKPGPQKADATDVTPS